MMSAMGVQACIFDLDGTLADTLVSIAGFVNETLGAFGLPPIPVGEYALLVGNGADTLLRRALARVGADFPPERFRAFRAAYDRSYESDPLRDVAVYPGVPELLAALRGRGLRLGVLSNKPDNMVQYLVQALFPGLLDLARGQREGVPKKPDPAPALALAADLGVAPERALFVGDSGVDMETALAAGMEPCGVLWGFRGREELEAAGARRLAATPAEIEKIAMQ